MALSALLDLTIAAPLIPKDGGAFEVSAMLPGHAAYARVLNPVHDPSGSPLTWRSLAGEPIRPGLQWNELLTRSPQPRDLREPEMGTIDPASAAELVRLLGPRTATPDRCVFLVWEGYAGLNRTVATAPRVTIGFENRTMHALQGTVDDALGTVAEQASSSRLPLWWLPLDHAWSVGNDLYGRSVYVGGAPDVIDAVLNSPALESLPVPPDHEVGQEDL